MGHSILVIDDSDEARTVIRKFLEAEGYAVCEAADGEDGVVRFVAEQPALVICDLMMPKKDGFDTVREIRRLAPSARIVAMSGALFGFADHTTLADSLGLAAVIEKPFRQTQLIEVVRHALPPG